MAKTRNRQRRAKKRSTRGSLRSQPAMRVEKDSLLAQAMFRFLTTFWVARMGHIRSPPSQPKTKMKTLYSSVSRCIRSRKPWFPSVVAFGARQRMRMTGRTKKEAEMKTKMKMKMSEQSAQPSIGYVLSNTRFHLDVFHFLSLL
ncbi:hypothetical protein M413DRAFT_278330 [Hebeloma cylindrosporum]|uniref:Uncharacterized protein n=1 Tax=Hebeloma cylindrosporum TaxID=76867 RepID=A0A0C3BKA6_HEBCY|nr:hypothetical protein M413DRAFT_278330 [Hebeloma cylindrosporum h7]